MFENEVRNIGSILEKFLGEPKDDYSYDGWSHWNCPCCAERKGVECDNKFNLEINIRQNIFHCWVDGESENMKGRLSTLIKRYGNDEIFREYKNEINNIKQSSLYEFCKNGNEFNEEFELINDITYPEGFQSLSDNFKNKEAFNVLRYLKKRGVTKDIIIKFNMGFVPESSKTKYRTMKNRVIVPSYDKFGDLNYWVGRDITGKSKMRYKNPKVEKTKFIFNEGLVNWYEDVTLVEGVFDHIVTPNSIPLLGKTLTNTYCLYDTLVRNAKANVNVFLDDDALTNAKRIYKLLDESELKGRVRLILSPMGHDASLLFEKYGAKGVINTINNGIVLDEYEMFNVK